MTRQRRVLLDLLSGDETHPTADEVFRIVRRELPHISLSTVYRNLEALSELEMIGRLDIPGGQRRFDPDTSPHYHVRCTGCGAVRDLAVRPVVELEQLARTQTDYQVTGHRLEFVGRCPQCKTTPPPSKQEGEAGKGRGNVCTI